MPRKFKIKRHKIVDLEHFRDVFETALDEHPRSLDSGRYEAVRLDGFVSDTLRLLRSCWVVVPESPEIGRWLRLAAQGFAAHYATASSDGPVTVPLGEGETVTYTDKPDESTVETRWMEGFFLGALCRDKNSLKLLCQTPTDLLRKSSSKASECSYLFVDALRSFWKGNEETGELILKAMRATDPKKVNDPDWVLSILIHHIRLLLFVHFKDPDFEPAMVLALKQHKEYWSKGRRRYDPEGYLPLELLGLAALAYDRGIPFEIDSDYLPMKFVREEF